ncbi:hypothetical protein IFM89_028542 [Coptis chinensis]|uniref:Uncharacterized protein n=1 Tax=Coptis chinensis TaxID=261450 RepID=A0A835M9X5_9MAGN|nr:hypothetical protein IFM89_028542 [Coptis chinensis]
MCGGIFAVWWWCGECVLVVVVWWFSGVMTSVCGLVCSGVTGRQWTGDVYGVTEGAKPICHFLEILQVENTVRSLLNKDYRKRLTAAQALSHPWLSSYQDVKIPMDSLTLKLVKAYICTSPLRKSALVALAKTLTASQLAYFQKQFTILGPNRSGFISMKKFKLALTKTATDAMKDSRVLDYVERMTSLQYRKLDFEEFCAASISVHQMEAMESWEQHAHGAYELFENEGNRPIFIEELASELGLSVPLLEVHNDWIRQSDGKLSFLGFVRLLHGASSRPLPKVLR